MSSADKSSKLSSKEHNRRSTANSGSGAAASRAVTWSKSASTFDSESALRFTHNFTTSASLNFASGVLTIPASWQSASVSVGTPWPQHQPKLSRLHLQGSKPRKAASPVPTSGCVIEAGCAITTTQKIRPYGGVAQTLRGALFRRTGTAETALPSAESEALSETRSATAGRPLKRVRRLAETSTSKHAGRSLRVVVYLAQTAAGTAHFDAGL